MSVYHLHANGLHLENFFKYTMVDGQSTKFWYDPWFFKIRFLTKYHMVFELKLETQCIFSNRLNFIADAWLLRRIPRWMWK